MVWVARQTIQYRKHLRAQAGGHGCFGCRRKSVAGGGVVSDAVCRSLPLHRHVIGFQQAIRLFIGTETFRLHAGDWADWFPRVAVLSRIVMRPNSFEFNYLRQTYRGHLDFFLMAIALHHASPS
jgi:hypothetical protein